MFTVYAKHFARKYPLNRFLSTNASEVAKGFKEYPKEFMPTLISIIVVGGGAYGLTRMIRKEINEAVKSIEVKVDSINSNTNERLGRLENQLLKFAEDLGYIKGSLDIINTNLKR